MDSSTVVSLTFFATILRCALLIHLSSQATAPPAPRRRLRLRPECEGWGSFVPLGFPVEPHNGVRNQFIASVFVQFGHYIIKRRPVDAPFRLINGATIFVDDAVSPEVQSWSLHCTFPFGSVVPINRCSYSSSVSGGISNSS